MIDSQKRRAFRESSHAHISLQAMAEVWRRWHRDRAIAERLAEVRRIAP